MLDFEDFVVGRVDRYGDHKMTRAEVIAFATDFDPQPFHLDDAAAAANPLFGRLAASGWHTAVIGMRMGADHWASFGGRPILGGLGIDNLRWLTPVYPGDTLRCESEVLEARPSRSKADRGIVRTALTMFNQHDEPVLRQESVVLVSRRQPAEG